MTKRMLLTVFLIIPGVAWALVCGYYALKDWSELRAAYHTYHALAGTNADLRALFAAYSAQDIHRINLFADGVWALLGLVLAAIGLHGLCTMRQTHE